jgi:hypothetical protein
MADLSLTILTVLNVIILFGIVRRSTPSVDKLIRENYIKEDDNLIVELTKIFVMPSVPICIFLIVFVALVILHVYTPIGALLGSILIIG